MSAKFLLYLGIVVCYVHLSNAIRDDVLVLPDDNGQPMGVLLTCPKNFTFSFDLPKQVRFLLYRNINGVEKMQLMAIDKAIPSIFIMNATTKMLIPGALSTSRSSMIQNLKKAYLKSPVGTKMNVIVVDWRELAGSPYIRCFSGPQENGDVVGVYIGRFIDFLVSKKAIDLEKLHLIGHSLGAHVAGAAGATAGGDVARITGLDPIGVNYCRYNRTHVLSKADAQFVDIIHSDTGMLGMQEAYGHADFYPWGGAHQPPCDFPTCSHSQAHVYFGETILAKDRYPAKACETLDEVHNTALKLKGPVCRVATSNFLGEATDMNQTGYFYTSEPKKSSSGRLSGSGVLLTMISAVALTMRQQQ